MKAATERMTEQTMRYAESTAKILRKMRSMSLCASLTKIEMSSSHQREEVEGLLALRSVAERKHELANDREASERP